MHSSEFILHKVLVEYFASDTTRSNKAGDYELENNDNDCKGYISVKIEFFLISEEYQEKS